MLSIKAGKNPSCEHLKPVCVFIAWHFGENYLFCTNKGHFGALARWLYLLWGILECNIYMVLIIKGTICTVQLIVGNFAVHDLYGTIVVCLLEVWTIWSSICMLLFILAIKCAALFICKVWCYYWMLWCVWHNRHNIEDRNRILIAVTGDVLIPAVVLH